MDNVELEQKVKEILNITNFFDMLLAAKEFEKDYKASDFYKITKIPLMEVLKEVKSFYTFSVDAIVDYYCDIMKGVYKKDE